MVEPEREIIIFQLTRLVRGVTGMSTIYDVKLFISTHTPRERRDSHIFRSSLDYLIFQLTRLVRGVTRNLGQ